MAVCDSFDLTGQALFRVLVATAIDGIIAIDEEGLVRVYNPACEKLFGYGSEEVIGHNVKLLMPSHYRDQHDGHLAHYRRSGEKRVIGKVRVVTGRRRDGSTFPMELAIGEIAGGSRRLFTGFVRDITERQGTQQRLQELQSELLHVSRLSAMGQMTAAIAHELNQPLTAIANYVKAGQRTLAAPQSQPGQIARAEDFMAKAAGQALRAGLIIRNLRSFAEKRASVQAPENLNTVVEQAIALGFAGAVESGVTMQLKLDPALAPVLIDKIQIQQVLMNLIRNSLEAMARAAKRELTISTAAEDGGFAQVTVADTGTGLPAEVTARLFQPFVTTKEEGMGIGLSICRSIMDRHGGRIWALPDVNAGAAFRIRLPFAIPAERAS
jgi:two-component system, LuxR family, sensor kinase FixL